MDSDTNKTTGLSSIAGTSRVAGLDLVRCGAVAMVVGLHFFVNTQFYTTPFRGVSMFAQSLLAELMLAGVPLFLLLTGYLNAEKSLSRSYYKGLLRVISAYVAYSLLTVAVLELFVGDHRSPLAWLLAVVGFEAIPYAWYIEMWLGLFLLAPFLNILYKALPSKRHKQVLIATLAVISLLPLFLNRKGYHVWPRLWEDIYPLAFYFTGSYIREFRPTVRPRVLLAVVCILLSVDPLLGLLHPAAPITPYISGSYYPFGLVLAVCVFLLLYRCEVRRPLVRSVLAKVSVLSLDVFLVSYVFDSVYYPWFTARFFTTQSQFGLWWFVLVPLVLVSSLAVAFVVNPLLPKGKRRQTS
ncbi:MAG: acyltransferase [Bacteroidaceae bacterium]|nr:acyltransferase [Bacteroidaceae bacterium]